MPHKTERRRLSTTPLILLVMLVTTAAPLLVLAEERDDREDRAARDAGEAIDETIDEIVVEGRQTRYSATKSDTPIMESARSVSIEDRQPLIDKSAINLDSDTGAQFLPVYGTPLAAPNGRVIEADTYLAERGAQALQRATVVVLGLLLATYAVRFGEDALAPAALGVNVLLASIALVFAWLAHRPTPSAAREKAVGAA